MAQSFQYRPLTEPDSIRLLELQPSLDPDAALECSLIHTTFSSDTIQDIFSNYAALSYVWGSELKFETIWIDKEPLKITANLFSALRDLRDKTRPFYIWADGICINQSDSEEKSIQVQMMGQIYASASNTIIYLGPSDPDSIECRSLSVLHQDHGLTHTDMFYSIINKDWFTRVWVFQEFVFSSNPWVQCGKVRVKWQKMYRALEEISPRLLDLSQNQRFQIISDMQHAWKSHRGFKGELLTIDLASARRGLGVSDPRDMLFAHVGFAADGRDEELLVDYSKTCAQVYTDFARHIARSRGFLRLLEWLTENESHIQNLPSWVPDWTSNIPRPAKFHIEDLADYVWKTPMVHIIEWVSGLGIPTAIVGFSDTISRISLPLSLGQVSKHIRQAMASRIANLNITFNIRTHHEEPMFDIERTDIGVLNDIWAEVYQIWRGIIEDDEILGRELVELGLQDRTDIQSSNYLFVFPSVTIYLLLAFAPKMTSNTDYITGRALARTSSGRLALVHTSTKEGDMIIPLSDDKDKFKEYVVRPIQPARIYIGDDNKIREATSQANPSHEGSITNASVLHCELIADCLREGFSDRTYSYELSQEFVLALH